MTSDWCDRYQTPCVQLAQRCTQPHRLHVWLMRLGAWHGVEAGMTYRISCWLSELKLGALQLAVLFVVAAKQLCRWSATNFLRSIPHPQQ